MLLAISYNIVSCVNVCVCGVYIVSDCVLDERLCTVWCMCSINSYVVADDTLFLHSARSVLQTVHFRT